MPQLVGSDCAGRADGSTALGDLSEKNLVGMFRRRAEACGNAPMLRAKRGGAWQRVTWNQVRSQVDDLASGLIALGVRAGDRVALVSENRAEWIVCDLAILTCGAVTVGAYDTLTAPQIEQRLADCGARAAIISSREQLDKIEQARARLPELQHVVLMDEEAGAGGGDGVVALRQVMERGRECHPGGREERAAAIRGEDLAALIYVTREMGEPLGVMLSHDNFVAACEATSQALPAVGPGDRNLCFVQLSHVYARVCDYYAMINGSAPITLAESWEKLGENMREVRPTLMNAVPRLYARGRGEMMAVMARRGSWRRRLDRWSLATARAAGAARRAGQAPGAWLRARRALAEAITLRGLRGLLGGKMRFMTSGGAPLEAELVEFFDSLGVPVLEGFGVTETAAAVSVNPASKIRPGSFGRALPGVELRIAQDGEILARGPNVMKGYWQRPTQTAQAIEKGWFHTRHLGYLDNDGYLYATERKADFVVTAGGRIIAPQVLESLLRKDPLIAEAVVWVDRQGYPCALIVPDFEELRAVVRSRSIAFTTWSDLVAQQSVQQLYRSHIDVALAELAPFEQVRRFAILDLDVTAQPWYPAEDPRARRRELQKRYSTLLETITGAE